MTRLERWGRLSDRLFDRLRSKRAFTLTHENAVEGDFTSLRGHRYMLLVTFRRNGDAVPSPVWFSVDNRGRAYVKTRLDAGKAKRLRRDSRAVVALSNMRGKPSGPAIRGTARVLPKEEWTHAEATLAAAYGAGRKISERLMGGPEEISAYIEITPVNDASELAAC